MCDRSPYPRMCHLFDPFEVIPSTCVHVCMCAAAQEDSGLVSPMDGTAMHRYSSGVAGGTESMDQDTFAPEIAAAPKVIRQKHGMAEPASKRVGARTPDVAARRTPLATPRRAFTSEAPVARPTSSIVKRGSVSKASVLTGERGSESCELTLARVPLGCPPPPGPLGPLGPLGHSLLLILPGPHINPCTYRIHECPYLGVAKTGSCRCPPTLCCRRRRQSLGRRARREHKHPRPIHRRSHLP